MKNARNHIQLLPTYIGTGLSFLAYLFIGAAPGILYGGLMGLMMANAILGTVADPTILHRIITGGGMVLGILASLSFFLVAGAFFGTVLGLPFAPMLRRWAEHQPTEHAPQAAHVQQH